MRGIIFAEVCGSPCLPGLQTAVRCGLLSEQTFSRRKYSTADCSAVRPAVRTDVFEAKIQHGRQQCGAACCQNRRFRGENTARRTAVRCGLLSEQTFSGRKYSSAYCSAVRPAVRLLPAQDRLDQIAFLVEDAARLHSEVRGTAANPSMKALSTPRVMYSCMSNPFAMRHFPFGA